MQTKYFNLAISGLAILAGIATANGQQNPGPGHSPKAHSADNSYMSVETDSSVNPPQTRITTYKEKQLYIIRTVDDKIIDLSVDGRKVASDSFYVYDAMVRRIETQIKHDRAEAEEDRKQAIIDAEEAKRDAEQAKKDEQDAQRDAEQAQQDAQQAVRDARQAERDAEQVAREDSMQARQEAEQARQDRKQALEDRAQAQKDREQALKDRAQARADAAQARRDAEQAGKDGEQAGIDAKHAAEDQAKMKSLIAELVKEGLVADGKSLYSLEVSDTDLIINGKKQPEELRKRLCAQFKIGPDYSISYNR
jgi:hypothetical protein